MNNESIQLVLKVEKSKFGAFLEMLKLFEFVSVESLGVSSKNETGSLGDSTPGTEKSDIVHLRPDAGKAEERILSSIQHGAEEVKLHLEGKKQLRSLQSLLDEL